MDSAAARQRRYRLKYPEREKAAQARFRAKPGRRAKATAYMREWRKRRPELAKAVDLRKKFGLTLVAYNQMLAVQNGVCAICARPPTSRALSVDHCHKTGKVRNLLCHRCNTALGLLDENIDRCHAVARYIAFHHPPSE